MVALAIALVLCAVLWTALRATLRTSERMADVASERAHLDAFLDELFAQADSAWVIFVPSQDVLGSANADGHEVDFFARDSLGRNLYRAYRFDPSAQSIQSFTYDTPGGAAVALGAPLGGIAEFDARRYPVSALHDASSPAYNALFAAGAPASASVDLGAGPGIAGGNDVVRVAVRSTGYERHASLVTQVAPSGFTVVFPYTPAPSAAPCAPDALGYCAVKTSDATAQSTTTCTFYQPYGGIAKTQQLAVRTGSITYDIYRGTSLVGSATDTIALAPEDPPQIDPGTGLLTQPTCPNLTPTWTPYEPAVQFADPNLP